MQRIPAEKETFPPAKAGGDVSAKNCYTSYQPGVVAAGFSNTDTNCGSRAALPT